MMGNLKTRLTRIESRVLKKDIPRKGLSGLLAWHKGKDDDPAVTWSGPHSVSGMAALLLTAEEWQRLTEKEERASG
jgi:hypothetical protein